MWFFFCFSFVFLLFFFLLVILWWRPNLRYLTDVEVLWSKENLNWLYNLLVTQNKIKILFFFSFLLSDSLSLLVLSLLNFSRTIICNCHTWSRTFCLSDKRNKRLSILFLEWNKGRRRKEYKDNCHNHTQECQLTALY